MKVYAYAVLMSALTVSIPIDALAKKKSKTEKGPTKVEKTDAQILSQNLKLLVAPKDKKIVQATMKMLKKDEQSGVSQACKASKACLKAQAIAYQISNGNSSLAHTVAVRECADAQAREKGQKKSKVLKSCLQKVGAMKKKNAFNDIQALARVRGGILQRTQELGMQEADRLFSSRAPAARSVPVTLDAPTDVLVAEPEAVLEAQEVAPAPSEQAYVDAEEELGSGGF